MKHLSLPIVVAVLLGAAFLLRPVVEAQQQMLMMGQNSGTIRSVALDSVGHLFSRSDHINRFHCVVAVSTATTIQAVGGSCAAPGASSSLYVTDITFAASAAGIGADAFPTLKYGTGGTCGSGTTVFWQALTAAAIVAVENRAIPIKIPANNEICWIASTAGSKTLQVSGFTAP